ncbi:hypothetical protein ARMGADRAFT_505713 [Armillaria gallica]|uniref:Uncharacterized protein n=1 Tax=Armillaria gallica TaxID=47427 RepID=A0A2H3DWB2_ARMGA|nr:hypothetical protein ARMGADRAFT_505713 [Armillaria gallica]
MLCRCGSPLVSKYSFTASVNRKVIEDRENEKCILSKPRSLIQWNRVPKSANMSYTKGAAIGSTRSLFSTSHGAGSRECMNLLGRGTADSEYYSTLSSAQSWEKRSKAWESLATFSHWVTIYSRLCNNPYPSVDTWGYGLLQSMGCCRGRCRVSPKGFKGLYDM